MNLFPTGKYYIATMTMITASTALTIFIMNIHHCGPDAKPVPKWAKKVILQYLAKVCFVYEVGENCLSPQPEKQEPPSLKKNSCPMNGRAGSVKDDCIFKSDRTLEREETSEDKEDMDQMVSPIGSMGQNPTNQYSCWKNGIFNSMDCEATVGQRRNRKSGTSGGESKDGECNTFNSQNNERQLLRNIEYISNCYRDQRATQKRTGEWKKVAKVLDRFFMWIFFIMVFSLSLLIMGKAI